jgi:peptidoglycan/LPS O-acetylase OafA/YrhL
MPFAAANSNARSWHRLDGVDILRGLAIFFVLMNHVNMRLVIAGVPYTEGLPKQLVSSLVWNGQFGVQIFFAVSGFLITSTALRRWSSLGAIQVREFYALRFARIAPLLLLLLLVLSGLHFLGLEDFVVRAKTGGLGRALFAALTFHVNVLEARRGYLPANWDILWSLSVEEMFYLFFPPICKLLGRLWLLITVLFAFVFAGPFGRTVLTHGNELWQDKSYLGSMDAIALGCLTALLVSRVQFSRRTLPAFLSIGLLFLTFILGFSRRAYSWGLGDLGLEMTILAIGTCLVIIVAAQTRWKAPRLLAPLLNLGQRSYEVYLTHMFVVFAFFHIFLATGTRLAAIPAFFIGVIIVAALLGEAVARFFSDPMNHLLRARCGDGPEKLGSAIQTEETDALNTSAVQQTTTP